MMRFGTGVVVVVAVGMGLMGSVVHAQNSGSRGQLKETMMTKHATGNFEVKVSPQPAEEAGGGAGIGRMLLDKQFHDELEATSKGQMLASGTGAKGSSGGYVAMEVVTGTLGGRKGTFVLQHTGTINRGMPELSVTVVPDSGTGELVGLTGKMVIHIAEGKHTYEFDYTVPVAQE